MAPLRFWLRAAATLLVSVAQVSQSQIDSYTPISHYASAGYCKPDATLAWNCGANCQANPSFKPVASGGDGVVVQFWFVGYDPTLKTVVVSIQGTAPSAILPLLTDSDIQLMSLSLNPTLFPGLDLSILAHQGFLAAHSMSASDVLAAVQSALSQFSTSRVLLTGHSLGAAISLLHSVYIPLHIPNAQVTYVGYGLPRVGNQAFADYIHIQDSGEWVTCAGQDNTNSQCIVGDVPTLLAGNETEHDGPYNGVEMGC
ncbi:lipase [Ganoderma leucocontextum]|nr:lipase [Ganoderma leucocontextum]